MMEWIRTRRRVVKKFDETIAARPILIASVTFSVGLACTAVAFLVTGINVSNEGTRFVHVYISYLMKCNCSGDVTQDGKCEERQSPTGSCSSRRS